MRGQYLPVHAAAVAHVNVPVHPLHPDPHQHPGQVILHLKLVKVEHPQVVIHAEGGDVGATGDCGAVIPPDNNK